MSASLPRNRNGSPLIGHWASISKACLGPSSNLQDKEWAQLARHCQVLCLRTTLTIVPVTWQGEIGIEMKAVDVPKEAWSDKRKCQIIWHVLYNQASIWYWKLFQGIGKNPAQPYYIYTRCRWLKPWTYPYQFWKYFCSTTYETTQLSLHKLRASPPNRLLMVL